MKVNNNPKKISVVINYCTNEKYFLDACIENVQYFSNDIVVSYGSKLYDGTPENIKLINESRHKYPNVKFVEYKVDPSIDLNQQLGVISRPKAYWHNLARWTGFEKLNNKYWTLFLDVDEIPDGKKFLNFIQTKDLEEDVIYKIANYWYYKFVNYQSVYWEDSAILLNTSDLKKENFFGDLERNHILSSSTINNVCRFATNTDGLPLIHHYSWVRTKRQLMFKLRNWGHASDISNGEKICDLMFSTSEFNNVIKNHRYIYVQDYFNIDNLLSTNQIVMPTQYNYSRNELCPCRLGKRYKDCHGSLTGHKNIPLQKSIFNWG